MATALQEAAIEVGSFLEQAHIPYVLIGGFAVQHWGEPRPTRDIDYVWEFDLIGEFEQLLNRSQ